MACAACAAWAACFAYHGRDDGVDVEVVQAVRAGVAGVGREGGGGAAQRDIELQFVEGAVDEVLRLSAPLGEEVARVLLGQRIEVGCRTIMRVQK